LYDHCQLSVHAGLSSFSTSCVSIAPNGWSHLRSRSFRAASSLFASDLSQLHEYRNHADFHPIQAEKALRLAPGLSLLLEISVQACKFRVRFCPTTSLVMFQLLQHLLLPPQVPQLPKLPFCSVVPVFNAYIVLPLLPVIDVAKALFLPSLLIFIVLKIEHLVIAKVFSYYHTYAISENSAMFAAGLSNMARGFFGDAPVGGRDMTRS
jgi:hypothetical protein